MVHVHASMKLSKHVIPCGRCDPCHRKPFRKPLKTFGMALFQIWTSPGASSRPSLYLGPMFPSKAIRRQALVSTKLVHRLTGLVFTSLTVAVVQCLSPMCQPSQDLRSSGLKAISRPNFTYLPPNHRLGGLTDDLATLGEKLGRKPPLTADTSPSRGGCARQRVFSVADHRLHSSIWHTSKRRWNSPWTEAPGMYARWLRQRHGSGLQSLRHRVTSNQMGCFSTFDRSSFSRTGINLRLNLFQHLVVSGSFDD